jgi:hypothetical protein
MSPDDVSPSSNTQYRKQKRSNGLEAGGVTSVRRDVVRSSGRQQRLGQRHRDDVEVETMSSHDGASPV